MIIGHQKQRQFLRNIVESEKIPHGFLFSGQSQLGKKTLAIEFIKLLNCETKDFSLKPCQKCPSCLQIEKEIHPDLNLVEPLDKEIQISQIRELCWKLSLKPYSSPFKTAIIDKAEKMNLEAANALLKTLEEPEGRAVLILISSQPERLPKTIVSRTQIIKFYPVPQKEIENFLRENKLEEGLVLEISRISSGKPGKALDFLSNSQKITDWQATQEELSKMANSSLAARFQYAKDLAEKNNLSQIFDIWLSYFRDVLLSKINSRQSVISGYSLNKLKNILQKIQTTNFLISTTNINPRLAIEILMLEL